MKYLYNLIPNEPVDWGSNNIRYPCGLMQVINTRRKLDRSSILESWKLIIIRRNMNALINLSTIKHL